MTRTSSGLLRITGGLLAAVVVLTGCSGGAHPSDGGPVDPGAGFNDADVAFAQGMIPHHEGALAMAEVAADHASDPRVVDLAQRIEAGQDPEIQLMTGWLEEWGRPLEETGGHTGGMGHGSRDPHAMDMPAAGPDFDRRWLDAMIEHHEGAVQMARTEIEEGRAPEALDLARVITETQTEEIAEMRQLLPELDG